MNLSLASRVLLDCYPRIFFACHRRHVRDSVTQQLLSSQQASILDHLDEVEPTIMSQLAMHLGVTASTMSLSIDRLEARGYVARERDQADARKVQLRLTRHGVRLKESQSVLDPSVVRSMLRRMPPAKRERALHGLVLLAAAATEEMHQRGSATAWRTRGKAHHK